MTRPHTYLVRMLLFLAAVAAASVLLFQPLAEFFVANAALNGLIVGVLLLGVVYNIRQVIRLYPEVGWIDSYREGLENGAMARAVPAEHHPKLLAPMATMVSKRDSLSLSALSMRSLLDSIASRLDESRDLSRYTIGLLIFLGLLGTFWGLLQTVGSISGVISGLSVEGGDPSTIFSTLKRGLEAPMAGMGTAFSSSLFGLAGSLVLGFLDLQAGQAQNRFYNDLEEWLSSVTRLSSGGLMAEGEQSVPAYVQALLEQTAESLENLQRTLMRGEEGRSKVDASLISLSAKLETLTDQMRTEQALMKSLAETQVAIRPILQQLAQGAQAPAGGLDDASRAHIRNMDLHVSRMLDEMRQGRETLTQDLRREIKLLARTVAAASEDGSH
ncbi:MAG: flagellar motor protein MotA [Rhodospirillaceae bacterium]